jgi:hypothetical protein
MVVADQYRLTVPWGTPPGEYQVLIGAYSGETGQRLRPECRGCQVRDSALILAPVQVAKAASQPPPGAASTEYRLNARLNDELELVGFDLGQSTVHPGQTVPLILTWRALADVAHEYAVSLALQQTDGATRLRGLEEPVGVSYPPSQWKRSDLVRDWHDLQLPADIPTGDYELTLRVLEGGRTIGQASLGRVQVRGRPHQFDVPEIQHPLEARLGDGVLFLGYDLSSEDVKPGDTLHLTLYCQALSEMQVSYTVFTHLLDANERTWGQMDSIPLRSEAPTTSWVSGEVIADEYDITVDAGAPPGDYAIEIGMYDASTGRRLPVSIAGRLLEGDRLVLGQIRVLP